MALDDYIEAQVHGPIDASREARSRRWSLTRAIATRTPSPEEAGMMAA
jgi:hypothetical protein